jgi:quercetin dioxygenase-like cupin family protein
MRAFLGRLSATAILMISATDAVQSRDPAGSTKPLSKVRFTQDPDVKCLSYAVEGGNPDTGPSTHILKFPKGCEYPWHYHTAEEQLLVVYGTVSVQMDRAVASSLQAGGFALMQSKEPHRFSCVAEHECMAFVHFDRAYDIYWVR